MSDIGYTRDKLSTNHFFIFHPEALFDYYYIKLCMSWYDHLSLLRISALLLDIIGTVLLIIAVLNFKETLVTERSIDDTVVAEIGFEKRYIYAALGFLCVAFVFLVTDEIIHYHGRKTIAKNHFNIQVEQWINALEQPQPSALNQRFLAALSKRQAKFWRNALERSVPSDVKEKLMLLFSEIQGQK